MLHAERVLPLTWRAWKLRMQRGQQSCGLGARACGRSISCVRKRVLARAAVRSCEPTFFSLRSCVRRSCVGGSCEQRSCVRHSSVRHSCALGPFFAHSFERETSGHQSESRLFFHPSSHHATTFWLQPYYELRYRGSERHCSNFRAQTITDACRARKRNMAKTCALSSCGIRGQPLRTSNAARVHSSPRSSSP